MSDFGSEVNNTALQMAGNTTVKLIEAILALLRGIYKTWENSPDRQIAKAKLHDIKDKVEQQKLFEKMEGKAGLLSHKKLIKAGVPLTATEIFMTKKDLTDFGAQCKREGITIAMAVNRKEIDSDGSVKYLVECKSDDLKRLENMIVRLNRDKYIEAKEIRINEIKAKGEENLTEQDKFDIQDLIRQQEEIRKGNCYELNNEQAKGVSERAVNGESKSGISFNEALDRYTGGYVDKDITCIVADATRPENHIKCHSQSDVYKDKP